VGIERTWTRGLARQPLFALLGQLQRHPPLGRVARQPRVPPLKRLSERAAVVREPVLLSRQPPRVGECLGTERHCDLAVVLPEQRAPFVAVWVLEEHAAHIVGIEPDRPLAGVRPGELALAVAVAVQGGAVVAQAVQLDGVELDRAPRERQKS